MGRVGRVNWKNWRLVEVGDTGDWLVAHVMNDQEIIIKGEYRNTDSDHHEIMLMMAAAPDLFEAAKEAFEFLEENAVPETLEIREKLVKAINNKLGRKL